MLPRQIQRLTCALIVFGTLVPSARAEETGEQAQKADSTFQAKHTGAEPIDLPDLPEVPSIELEKPSQESLEAVDDLLARLITDDPVVRERAVREILETKPAFVPAIQHRIDSIAEDCDRGAMKDVLLRLRRKAREAVRERMRAAGEKGEVDTPDYLQIVAEYAEPTNEHWQDLTQVLGLSRMLVALGTTPATRVLIHVYVRFDFLRIDTQLQLAKLDEKAIAALIETRRHPARKIATWADRQLDALGKAIPSEVVQTDDPEVLADILRAYGRVRDPDAARLVISFANTERAQVREAARQGVAMLGEVANWQLRDTYENIVGKKPPRDWSWKRTARELFGEFDRLRLARVFRLFESGKAAYKQGNLLEMCKAYDRVLAENPMFERRDEMVPGYVDFARAAKPEQLAEARLALARAARLSRDPDELHRIQSLQLTLEGERLLQTGLADQTLFRRALDLDAENARAQQRLESIERGEPSKTQKTFNRYGAAGIIGAVALVSILVIAFWRRKRPGENSQAVDETDSLTKRNPEAEPLPGETSVPHNAASDASAAVDAAAGSEEKADGSADAHLPVRDGSEGSVNAGNNEGSVNAGGSDGSGDNDGSVNSSGSDGSDDNGGSVNASGSDGSGDSTDSVSRNDSGEGDSDGSGDSTNRKAPPAENPPPRVPADSPDELS